MWFGIGFCVLQVLVALVRFGSMDSWNPAELLFVIPAILSGLILFFLGGLLVGLFAQRLRDGPLKPLPEKPLHHVPDGKNPAEPLVFHLLRPRKSECGLRTARRIYPGIRSPLDAIKSSVARRLVASE